MSSKSYLAYEQLPYWHAMQREGNNGSAALLERQKRMTLQKNHPTMDALISDQESIVSDSAANTSPSVVGQRTISTFQVPQS